MVLVVIGLLLLRQPTWAPSSSSPPIALGILFLGGVNGRMFFLGAAVLVAAFGLIIATSPVPAERILAFLGTLGPGSTRRAGATS